MTRQLKPEHPHYEGLYRKYLHNRAIKRVMELGVGAGYSLQIWFDWFTDAEIIGIDNKEREELTINTNRVKVVILDQEDKRLLDLGKFDMIIDDAGHDPLKQKRSLELLWPQLNPNGLYVVEDLETSYWGIASWDEKVLGGCGLEGWENPAAAVQYIDNLAHGITATYANNRPERFPKLDGLHAIHHHKNICFLEKD